MDSLTEIVGTQRETFCTPCKSEERPVGAAPFVSDGCFYLISMTMLPQVISRAPRITRGLAGSFRNRNARQMVITTLSLSMGATRETSPVCSALK